MKDIRLITRDELRQISLARAPLVSEEEHIVRWKALHKATFVGNIREEKVTVLLQGKKKMRYRIDTTLWACTNEWVVFKEGVRIPIESVVDVTFHQASEE